MSKPIKYKDTTAAPGSKLHAALEARDMKLAEKIYKECEVEYRKYFPKTVNGKDTNVEESKTEGVTAPATKG